MKNLLFFLDTKNINSARILSYILLKKESTGSFRKNELMFFFKSQGIDTHSHNMKENFDRNIKRLQCQRVFSIEENKYIKLFHFIEYKDGLFSYNINEGVPIKSINESNILDVLKLNSIFSIRLYEYLMFAYAQTDAIVYTANHEKAVEMSMKQFRFFTGLDIYLEDNAGRITLEDKYLRKQKYTELTNLKPKILKPVLEDIKTKTRYYIEFYNKTSEFYKITGFIFYIKEYEERKQIYLELDEFFELYDKIISEEKRHLNSKELKQKMILALR